MSIAGNQRTANQQFGLPGQRGIDKLQHIQQTVTKDVTSHIPIVGQAISISDFVTNTHNWLRLGEIVLGAIVLLLGLLASAAVLGAKAVEGSEVGRQATRIATRNVVKPAKRTVAAKRSVKQAERVSYARTSGAERARSDEFDRRNPDQTPPENADDAQPQRVVAHRPRTTKKAKVTA